MKLLLTNPRGSKSRRIFQRHYNDRPSAESLEFRTLLSTYDAAADFSTASNPNGVWSYGELVGGASGVTLYPTAGTTDVGLPGWTTGSDSPPYVGANQGAAEVKALTVDIPAGVLDMHPGKDGEYSVTQFTAATAGSVDVTFAFRGIDTGTDDSPGTTTDVHVLHNDVSIADGSINGYGDTFSQTLSDITVAAGDTIDFTVGWGANQNYLNDSTSLKAQITTGGKLEFSTPPKDGDAGSALSPVVVELKDAQNKVITSDSSSVVTLTPIGLKANPVVSGNTVQLVKGVATFSDLILKNPDLYHLTADDGGDTEAVSKNFQVSGDHLMFKGKISNGTPSNALKPEIVVDLIDKKGSKITNVSSVVTLSITGTNAGDPITGNTATIVGGTAVFSNLQFGKPGDYTLTATDDRDDPDATSNQITITGLHLAFKLQPTETGLNAPLKYKIEVEDYRNRLVNTSSIGLGLALTTVTGGTNAALSSVADTVDFGLATNSGSSPAKINVVGTYTVTYTVISQSSDSFDYTIDPITTNPFKVVANHLAFVIQPENTAVNRPLHYKIELENYKNDLVSSSDKLTLALMTTSGASGSGLTGNTDTLFNGVAANTGEVPIAINAPGSFTLTVTDVPATPGDPVAAAVTSKVFTVKLVVTS